MRKRLATTGAAAVLLIGLGSATAPAASAASSSVGPFATRGACMAERTLFFKEGYSHLGDCVLKADGWRFTINVLVPD